MPVFLLRNPDAVFIHIPKTAGRSIRVRAWEGRYERGTRGQIPPEWQHYFKFGFVRAPIDRLISAWLMFSAGRTQVPEMRRNRLLPLVGVERTAISHKTHRPLFPGLTIAEFLAIAGDESIELFTPRKGEVGRRATLRRHAVPQTHSFNGIDRADFIGRFENIDAEMDKIRERLGAPLPLPHSNRSRREDDWQTYFTPAVFDQAVEYYREDFKQLNYPIPRLKS
jgi:hypothetical protein